MCFAALIAACVVPAHAQLPPPSAPPGADPGALQRRNLEIERRIIQEQQRRTQPDSPERPVDTDALQPPKPAAPGDTLRFRLADVEFTASEILKPAELEALAAPLRGREVTFADLQGLVERINALYRERGVLTAQAVIPPQDIEGGKVRIRLVEGRIGGYRIEGNATTRERYVLGRLHDAPGTLFSLERLERDLVRFNRTNDVQARAELKPGDAFGTTDVLVRLTEPKRQSGRLFADNAGSKATGENRLGAIYQNRSLLGLRDELTLTGTYAEGYRGYGINYGVPWNTWGGRAQIGYFNDETEVINGPFRSLDLNGKSTAVIGAIRQPLITTPRGQLDAVLGGKTRTTENYAGSVLLQETDTRDVSLGADGSLADASGLWLGNLNVANGSYDITGGFSGNYTIARGGARRIQVLSELYSVRAGVNFQYSGEDFLPASEQFFIGGEGSVRGYSNALYGGNKGYVANLELHRPLWGANPEGGGTGINGFVFTDYGDTYPTRPPGSTLGSIKLWSVGAGAIFAYSKWLSGRLSVGYQLKEREEESSRVRVLFTLVGEVF
jgi:hemolysin activation/secretion protein